MRSTTSLLITLLGAMPAAAQSDSMRDLERMCQRIVDDPRPASLQAMKVLVDAETGARRNYLNGCVLIAEQKWGPAGNEFEKALKAEPGVAIYHFWFGRATGEQAQRANPIRQPGLARRVKGEFEKAAALDPTYIAPHEGLLRFYLAAPGFLGGSVDRARIEADAIMKLNTWRGGLAHSNVAFAAKDTAALVQANEKLVAEYPDSITPHFTLFNVQLAKRQWSAAWSQVDKIEKLKPDMPIVRYAIGRAAAESGEQLDRGEAALRKYVEYTPKPNEPSVAAAHWRLGMIAEHRGDRVAARQAYETSSKIDPNFKAAKEALARLK